MQLPRLREWRERRGLTQQELADLAEVARDSISKWEIGQRGAYPGTARKLADAMSIPVEELTAYPKSQTPLPTDWASSFPDEGFRRTVADADVPELVQAMKQHVGNQPMQTLEGFREDRDKAMKAGVERAAVFAHALIVDQELRARGYEEDPTNFLPDYKAWRTATGLE